MVRETRHLWVGNLPENIREERIREHFKRYGRVQSVKLLPGTNGSLCAAVAFMDIKSASKAHNCEHTLDEHSLSTEYYEPGPYTSSQQRFPIGISDDHSTFERTSHFYERGASTPGTPLSATGNRSEVDGYLRRSSVYHTPPDPLRGRPRDRPFRNGPPYPPGTERTSCSNNRRNWVYETGAVRYPSSSDEHGTGKTKKVRSGSESRSGSQSSRSRSPTRSTTGSPPSPDSSTRSDSPRSARVSIQSTVAPPVQQTASSTLAVYSEDRRPLAICVRNLPTRSSDTSLKDGLFHEYKKHGKVTWVKVVGTASERYALVCFKKPEDVEKAIEVSQDKLFFGCKIDVAPYHGYDVEDNEARPYDTELDEYHPKATRTLFIGNLEKDVTAGDIRQHFDQFGEIIEIDIKKQPGVTSSYAFCQYADIGSVVQAMRTLDGELLGESRLKLGFGKSMASSCVWIAGVAEQVSDKYLDLQFRKFGPVSHVVVDRERGQALIFYEQVSAAAAAVKEMRGVPLRGNRIQIDFASRECQEAFYERIDVQGRDNNWSSFESARSERDILCSRYDSSRFRYDPARVRSSSYSRSSGGRTPRRHEAYDSPRYKNYEELSPSSDHDEHASNDAPDLRHLHKERNHLQHLLDQLDRPLRSVTAADQGLVVTTHNHRRRLSSHQRSSGEGPAPLCKRRKTGSTSEDERKKHHHHHSGDERRPGTPLFDEKPDNIQPQEPRRMPRERPEEPLSLPLPQFAAQCFSNTKTACTPTTTVSHSTTVQQAPPASPVRPPSPSSTTSSSEISPQSPTLEERIRSLDEKYEKWTGRTLQPPTKPKHRLLDVDVRELQPSDIVKSVLAKPSVFDEDSKRLENFGEKYEPRDFSSYPRSVGLDVQRFVPGDPRNPSYISNLSVKVSPLNSPSGVLLSPCPAAKGLQYPFPSHPPVQPTTSVATTTAGSSSPPATAGRPISKSMEFSVQKAESWLGITKNAEPSTPKDSLISGGFAQRFNAYSKALEGASQRHNVMKLTDLVTQKIDIPSQKSVDPRIEKSNSVTAVTSSIHSQRVTVKSSDSVESNKADVVSVDKKVGVISNSCGSSNSTSSININSKIGTNSGLGNYVKNLINSSNSFNNSNSTSVSNNNNNSSSSSNNNSGNNGSNKNSVRLSVDRNDYLNSDKVSSKYTEGNVLSDSGKHNKDEESNTCKKETDSCTVNRVNSIGKCDEIAVKGCEGSVQSNSKSSKSDSHAPEQKGANIDGDGVGGVEKISVQPLDCGVTLFAETRVANKKQGKIDSENYGINSSDKPTIENKETDGSTNQKCESTKKLDSSLLKSNISHNKTANVILTESEGTTRSLSVRESKLEDMKANAIGSSGKTGDVTASKISENSVKNQNENNKLISSKSGSVSKQEDNPSFHVREKETGGDFGSEKTGKTATREREKSLSVKEDRSGRDVEKDRSKDKTTAEKEREKDKSLVREKQKDKEMLENVDKERKKDREVETERKKDRESMEVIEREKKKENELEKERKKDQSDVLDRRKDSSDKKCQDVERSKKKEEKKEKETLEKRKDSHSSDRHKKSSSSSGSSNCNEDKKKEKSIVQPASIGSKRRLSSQDSVEGGMEEAKRSKTEHKRRDSRESKSSLSSIMHTSASNNKIIRVESKSQESKSSHESKHKSSSEQRSGDSKTTKEEHRRRDEEKEKKKSSADFSDKKKETKKVPIRLEDVLKNVNDYNGKGSRESEKGAVEAGDEKKHGHTKKESKEKKKLMKQEFGSTESLEDKKILKKEKRSSGEKKKDDDVCEVKRIKEKLKVEVKKENGHDSDSDSDSEPKKHSIFDVVLDEPAYISMYDKVKARSCKNMQKQEEEKRQVKLKEKFSQLKQSRAKREEKKRSTSWDEDSDSDASQIRRIPRRSFSRLSSDDEGISKREKKNSESYDGESRRSKMCYYTSEDEGIKMKPAVHTSDMYSDESDGGFVENEEKSRKYNVKCKSKNVFESSEEESVKRPPAVSKVKENFHSTPKPEKVASESKNKVRLSLDSSTDRFCHEVKSKKRTLTESVSEGEPSYLSTSKSTEKMEKKKSKKKDKRQKSIEDDSKNSENDYVFSSKTDVESTKSSKPSKQERRKSVQGISDSHEDSFKQKKNKSKSSSHYDIPHKSETSKYDDIFDDYSDDSNENLIRNKVEVNASKGSSSKWQVAQVYGTDSDSTVDPGEHIDVGKPRKSKEKKRKEKTLREPSEELLVAGRALEKMLSSPPSRRNSEDVMKYCDSAEDFGGEEKLKINKEKKKKRKKSKDEKSSRHHHTHHHSYTEKIEDVDTVEAKAEIKPTIPVAVAHVSPSLPSLLDIPNFPSHVKQEPSSPDSPRVPPNSKISGFGYEMDDKVHESAVQSIALLDVAKVETKLEGKETMEDSVDKKEENKERTVISQEETEDAVAALLGETFTYSSCFEGDSPVETDPEPHDEEEMRQAVQSLNAEGKPDTPQSESGLQIDTDAEEPEEQFNGIRFDSLPRTPDLDLSQPPKTPDIQQSYVVETKVTPFLRKDTTRNSREEMEVPIVDPSSPDPLIPFQNVEDETKDKDVDQKPPLLKPASPKIYKDEPPTIEPISSISSAERIYVDNRLLLHPPPLVPVAKSVPVSSSAKTSPNLSIVRPMISLSTSSAPPTLVLTPIRTTTPVGVSLPNTQIPRKTFTISPTSTSIITTRSSVPPILSSVATSLSSPVKVSAAPVSESSNPSRFPPSATVVTSQHVPTHILPQKIILHQVSRAMPTRLIPAQGSVMKVVDTAVNFQKSAPDMPSLTPSEPVNTSQMAVSTLTTPAAPGCQPSPSVKAVFDIARSDGPQTASVISVLPRTIQTSTPSQIHSRPPTSSTSTTMPSVLGAAASTSVISVHGNAAEPKTSIPDCQHVIHHGVVSNPKPVNFNSPTAPSIPEVPSTDSEKISLPCSPLHTSIIETKAFEEHKKSDIQVPEPEIRYREKERPEEERRGNFKKEIIEQLSDTLDSRHKENIKENHLVAHRPEQSLLQPEHDSYYKNIPVEAMEHNESVIKKVDSLSSLKSEDSIQESPDICDKSDSSSINQEESLRRSESEDENRHSQPVATRKGRKKSNRVGVAGRKGKASGRPDTPGKRGGKGHRVGKASGESGKKQSKDVYEFHDESDEDGSGEKERPRLIFTIKSPNSVKEQPAVPAASKPQPAASKSPKEGVSAKSPEPKPAIEKDQGATNTRKSRRLQEKDGNRNTVDDIIEDVVRNGGHKKAASPRRSLRQVTKTNPVLPVKKMSPRIPKKSAGSISTDDEAKEEVCASVTTSEMFPEEKDVSSPPNTVSSVKDDQEAGAESSDDEPTTLIDPVTGMLMVMRAKEEGKYVPVANVPPIAPPTPPPPPPAKAEVLPIVTEGLASHWLTHETLKQAVIKVQNYGEGNKVNPVFMNRPPTPPTTPQTRIQDPVTRLPLDIMKKVSGEQMLEPEPGKPETDMNKIVLQPMELSKQKMCHVEQGKIYSEINRLEFGDRSGAILDAGKMMRQIPKTQPPVPVAKNLCSKGVAILTSPNKQLYQNPKHLKMSPQSQILTGAVASSPPRVVKTTVPAHELHPMTGAVASPPPRAPHMTSQQPVVTGASSSRALVDPPKGPGSSPGARGMTIPPYEATLQTPTQNLHSPPPAHQQGEGINMGHLGHPPFVHPQLMYQQYLRAQEMMPAPYQLTASMQGKLEERERERGAGDMGRSPPLELRNQRTTDSPTVYMGRQQYTRYYDDPPPAHLHAGRHIHQAPDPPGQPRLQIATPPHASQVPPQADSLLMLLQRYPIMWQGLLALKNDQSAVQMHFVFGNPHVARDSLPCNSDGSTPPLRIAQRMRLEQTQLEGVARKMQMDNEHCMLLALPCGRDHMDVLQQSTNLQTGFITYLQQKQAAGIVNIAHPGSQQAAYVVHIFPSCEFANENLARNAPDLLHRMQEIPHLLIVIATV